MHPKARHPAPPVDGFAEAGATVQIPTTKATAARTWRGASVTGPPPLRPPLRRSAMHSVPSVVNPPGPPLSAHRPPSSNVCRRSRRRASTPPSRDARHPQQRQQPQLGRRIARRADPRRLHSASKTTRSSKHKYQPGPSCPPRTVLHRTCPSACLMRSSPTRSPANSPHCRQTEMQSSRTSQRQLHPKTSRRRSHISWPPCSMSSKALDLRRSAVR